MLNLIYRNRDKDFNAMFMNIVHEYDATKLDFNTREEYLNWVKQWKEDMKIITLEHTVNKYARMRDVCKLPEKINLYQAKIDKLPDYSGEEIARSYGARMKQMLTDYNLKDWVVSSYCLVWYMLILRHAAKRKAAKQRESRIKEKQVV